MKSKKILLVEDNPDDETLILMSLRKSGISEEVVVARDGQEAIDYLFESPPDNELPAVVILDLKLPKLDGHEVLQRIRSSSRTRLQPVVILTSSDEARDRLKSYDLGANSYVCKPVDFAEFDEAVERLGAYWTRLNKTPKD
ncbi:MAG TPA: response regulator [Elusimicrobiota bacterium]|jgi:CheY-like chemotaxis protein|nr:response regulator [Elusimicrobiota bacterium]